MTENDHPTLKLRATERRILLPLGANDELHSRRLNVLKGLKPGVWVTPLELGAWDSSYHSRDLGYLVKNGLVVKRRRYVGISGGRNTYSITPDGQRYVNRTAELRDADSPSHSSSAEATGGKEDKSDSPSVKTTGDKYEKAMENCMKLNRVCDSQGLIAQMIGTLESLHTENTALRKENERLEIEVSRLESLADNYERGLGR